MMKRKHFKKCKAKGCDKLFTPFRTTDKYCSWECASTETKHRPVKVKAKINPVSKKQKVINAKYSVERIQYLGKKENQTCFIDGCNKKATTIEHRRGRGQGYFDKWAEENNICKTLDQRYWAPCCHYHNLELERNPELSKQYQLSKLHGGKKE